MVHQIQYIVMLTKEMFKIVNSMTTREGVLVLERGQLSHNSEYALSSTLSIYSTWIAIYCINGL